MTSLHLQEALREPSANATPASTPQSAKDSTPDAPSAAAAAGASEDRGGHLLGADDSFWVYRPKTASGASAREEDRKAAAPLSPMSADAASKTRQGGLSLREAAALAGASKSTILRAVQSGRLAAPKAGDGSYAIEPAALLAAFPPKSRDGALETSGKSGGRDLKSPGARPATANEVTPDVLAARMAALEAEIKSLKTLLGKVNPPRTWWRKLAG